MIATVRDAIRAALEAQPSIADGVSIYTSPEGDQVPYIRIELDQSPRYHLSFGGNQITELTFRLLLVPGTADDSGVELLDAFLSPDSPLSVIDAITATSDPALADMVVQAGDYDPEQVIASILLTIGVS
jgi:hypothetical protein